MIQKLPTPKKRHNRGRDDAKEIKFKIDIRYTIFHQELRPIAAFGIADFGKGWVTKRGGEEETTGRMNEECVELFIIWFQK